MNKLKEMREKKGLTQTQLSELSGIGIRVIQSYEGNFEGSRKVDKAVLDTLLKLAAALDCRIYEFLEDPELQKQLVKYENMGK
jgi:transcriptional regulator with XRE-family HTH domain